MSLTYIKDFNVKTKGVYRCSCGATVIADKDKVESGERDGCRICDRYLDFKTKGCSTKVKKDDDIRDYQSNRFFAGAKFGSLTLTGSFYRTYSNHRNYEAICTCGKIQYYTTNVLSAQDDGCRHHRLKPRLKAGDVLGVYKMLEPTDKRYHKRVVYKFECQECGTVKESCIAGLYNYNKCNCDSKKRKYTKITVGESYGIYTVLKKVSTKREGDTKYLVKCGICGFERVLGSSAIGLIITHCMHPRVR